MYGCYFVIFGWKKKFVLLGVGFFLCFLYVLVCIVICGNGDGGGNGGVNVFYGCCVFCNFYLFVCYVYIG